MKLKINNVAILGMGLMGGSLGKTLLNKKIAGHVTGWGRNIEKLNKALIKGAATKITTDLKDAVKDADLVIISLPVSLIPTFFKKIKPFLKKNCIVTDMGSIKVKIIKEISKEDKETLFIGSHPMVGSEKTGIDNIKDNLFSGSVCIVTPYKNSDAKRLKFIKLFWEKTGMQVIFMSPFEHDRYVSGISHLPHLLAFLLVKTQKNNLLKRRKIIGKGFLDTTRIAASGEEIWTDIFSGNKNNLLNEINNFRQELNRFKMFLIKGKKNKIKKLIKEAKSLRELLK